MKLKYYMRGVGLGIIFATVIFMVIIVPRVRESAEQEALATIKEKEDDNQTNLSKILDSSDDITEEITPEPTEEVTATPEVTETNTPEPTETEETTPEPTSTPEPTDTPEPTPTATVAPTSTPEPTVTEKAEKEKKEKKDKKDKKDDKKEDEYIVIGISRGMSSEQFTEKAEALGLVEDAKDFNKYIVRRGCADYIAVGDFKIKVGASYEEILDTVMNATNSLN